MPFSRAMIAALGFACGGAALADVDLAVSKSANKSTADVGESVVFTVVVTDADVGSVGGIGITDLLPGGLTYDGYSASQGFGYDPTSGVWSAGGLAAGGSATLTLTTTVSPGPIAVTNPTPGNYDLFGYALAVANSNRLAVGTPYDATGGLNAGLVYLFDGRGNMLQSIAEPSAKSNNAFGHAVVAPGSNRFVVSSRAAAGTNMQAGRAYLYDDSGALLHSLTNPAPHSFDRFGDPMFAVGGGRFLIASEQDSGSVPGVGVGYLYDSEGTFIRAVSNPTPASYEFFGTVVAGVGSNRFVVGSPGDNPFAGPETSPPKDRGIVPLGSVASGAAYIYDQTGSLLATVTNPTPFSDDLFGQVIAPVGGSRIAISAYQDNIGAENAGTVYLYDLEGQLTQVLTNPAPNADDNFGYTLAGSEGNDRLAVGIPYDSTALYTNAGSVALYDRDGNLLRFITSPEPASYLFFGSSIAWVQTNLLAIYSAFDTSAGRLYLYDANGCLTAVVTNPAPDPGEEFGAIAQGGLDAGTFVLGTPWEGVGTNAGAGKMYFYNANVLLGLPVVNRAWISASDQADPVSFNDTFSTSFTPNVADLDAAKTLIDGRARTGDVAAFRVVVSNAGPGVANSTVATEEPGPDLSYSNAVVSQGAWDATTLVWSVGALLPGAAATMDVSFTVDAFSFDLLTNAVTVSSATFDPVLLNNSARFETYPMDAYEIDDDALRASVAVINTSQVHNFHAAVDEDWLRFFGVPDYDYFISTVQDGFNVNLQMEVYREFPDGTLSNITGVIDTSTNSVGFAESYSLTPDAPGYYLVRLRPADDIHWGPDSDYEVEVDIFNNFTVLLLVVADLLSPNAQHSPSGAVAYIDGNPYILTNGTNSILITSVTQGVHTVSVPTPPGYEPQQDPRQPNQTANTANQLYGNPREIQIYDEIPTYTVFSFYPAASVSGRVVDAFTAEPVPGARLVFRARSGAISNLLYDAFPEGALYESNWLTQADGGFPTDVILPAVRWDLTMAKSGYETNVLPLLLTNLSPATITNVGTLYLAPVDTNGNGIADNWEVLYFGTNVFVATGDNDNDGQNNRNEYWTGTDPTNGMSYFGAYDANATDGFTIVWAVAKGRVYRVRETENLNGTNWTTTAGPWTAQVGQAQMQWTDTNTVAHTSTAYRVEVLAP